MEFVKVSFTDLFRVCFAENSLVVLFLKGRVLFDNLKKTIAYTLAHLWPEVLPVALTLAFSMPLALSSLVCRSLILCARSCVNTLRS